MGENNEKPAGQAGLFASGGVVTGLAALIGASCCVLPVLLVQAGVSAALVAHLSFFARAKPYMLAFTGVLVLAGFVSAFWGGRRPRLIVLATLFAAAAFVVGAQILPHYERDLLDWVRGR